MKNKSLFKMLLIGVISILLLSNITPAFSMKENNNSDNGTAELKVYNSISGINAEKTLNKEQTMKILNILFEDNSLGKDANTYQGKIEKIIQTGILDSENINYLNKLCGMYENYKIKGLNTQPLGPIFDLFNLFNGVFFAIKGTKDKTIFEQNLYTLPFINSNITAQFSLLSKFTGNGFIFTLGTFGSKYLYDFNNTKYDFPYFPKIGGVIIFFTGVLLELEIGENVDEQYRGSYLIGFGTNMLSIWNNQDEI